MNHDAIFLREACKIAATESGDPHTQNGAILRAKNGAVVSAANQLPPIITTEERLVRPAKYLYMEHAERNAIYSAARHGIATKDATLYCPWFACADCARAIILAGVTKVIGHAKPRDLTPERWRKSIASADEMLNEAGVEMVFLNDALGVRFLFDGQFLDL